MAEPLIVTRGTWYVLEAPRLESPDRDLVLQFVDWLTVYRVAPVPESAILERGRRRSQWQGAFAGPVVAQVEAWLSAHGLGEETDPRDAEIKELPERIQGGGAFGFNDQRKFMMIEETGGNHFSPHSACPGLNQYGDCGSQPVSVCTEF